MIKIYNYNQVDKEKIFAREDLVSEVSEVVKEIIQDVRIGGDKALLMYSEKFDGVVLENTEVSDEEIEEAFEAVDDEFLEILKEAADNIRGYHRM